MAKASAAPQKPAPDRVVEALKQVALAGSLDANLSLLRDTFKNCSDLVQHRIALRQGAACVLFIDGLVDKELIDREVTGPLLQGHEPLNVRQIAAGLTTAGDTNVVTTAGEAVMRILAGDAVLLLDGADRAIAYGVRGWQSRAIAEPATEAVIRGPREGFVETLRFNTALLRRKIHSPALKVVALTLGRITQTDVAVIYIEGIASQGVVDEVFSRLKRVDIDGVLESGYIEEFIEESPFSPFPQVQNTERPDTAAGQLLEGRVVILIDGTPFALIVPVVFAQLMQANEDYYERFLISSAVRALRYLFLSVALLLPSLYIAITTFHHEMLPSALLRTVAAAREGVPFPAFVEALLMEITFEILREGGLRLPRTVGQAVSIVGALVIGESAVRAGMVSAPMVIIVSITGIASFAIPRYNASIAIRMLRFPLMFLASTLGMFGIVAGLSGILIHLCSLRSFGVPYLAPVAPLNWQGMKDVLVRAPHWWRRLRPRMIGHTNPVRSAAHLRPGPRQGRAP